MTEPPADRRCLNGHPVRPGARYCPLCGTEVADVDDDMYDSEPPAPDQAPRHASRWATAIIIFVVVTALAIGVAALQSEQRDTTEPAVQIPTYEEAPPVSSSPRPTETNPATTPTGPPASSPSATMTPPPHQAPPPTGPASPPSPYPPQDPYTYESPQVFGIVDYTPTEDSRAYEVAEMLDSYFSGINTGRFERTRAVIDPRSPVNPDDDADWSAFVEGVSTSHDSDIVLQDVDDDFSGQGSAVAHVTFRSSQNPGYGPQGSEEQTCTRWDVRYTLSEPEPGQFLILSTNASHSPC